MKPRNHFYQCPVEAAFDCIGGRWKALIIWYIGGGVARYSDIKTNLPKITPHMLSLQLRALEEDGLISRTQILYYPEQIPADFIKRTPGRSACGTGCASGATDSS